MFHELFEGQDLLPYHIFLIDAETEHTHAHTELEICFLLCGEAEYYINHKSFPLYEHDFIVVRPLALHQIQNCSDNCRVLFLQIDLFAFQNYISDLSEISFSFSNIMNNRSHTLYQRLYQSLRNILNTAFSGNSIWRLTALQEIINILSLLIAYYHDSPNAADHIPTSYEEHNQLRMLSVLEYVNRHWNESLTLASVAGTVDMSPSYFSRFFKNNMGTGFLNYLTSLRLKRSINLLLETNMPIIEIAYECGFNDYKTYGRLFKKEFGDNPHVYRKTHTASDLKPDMPDPKPTQLLEQLFLTPPNAASSKKFLVPLNLNLNTDGSVQNRVCWNHTITVGSAARMLRRKIQEHILYARKYIPLRYIRFFDLFSDHMHVYWEHEDGTPHFSWECLDEVFDFLNRNQLLPFIVLDAMPDALSTLKHKVHSDKMDLMPTGQTCMPKSMENFQRLVREFICHYTHRYSTVTANPPCRIQLWSFPESSKSIWNGTEEQFFDLVSQTYFTIRNAAPEIHLGSPSTMGLEDFSVLKRFLQFCQHEKMHFDFFCMDSYGFTSPLNTGYPSIYTAYEKTFPYLEGDFVLNQSADHMADILSGKGLTQPVIVTEWGVNPYVRDLSRDTSFMATWITEHLLHLSSNIAEICYCLLTDDFSYTADASGYEFIGGQGLLTHSGIPKPSFSAFTLLGFLGNRLLAAGKDYLFTKTDGAYQLLIYNYSYYSEYYLNGRQELLFDEDRYNIYGDTLTKVFQIQLNLAPGRYRLETMQLDREHCAPYDEWIKMGKPDPLNDFYHQYLMNKCYPGLQIETIMTSEHLQIQRTVPVHGVMMIRIEPL